MGTIRVRTVKSIALQIIFLTGIVNSSKTSMKCVPMENCPTVRHMLENSNYSPEIWNIFNCFYSEDNFYIWCPNVLTDNSKFVDERMYYKNREISHSPTDLTNRPPRQNFEQKGTSKGFIWGETKSTSTTTSKTEEITNHVVHSGIEAAANTGKHPKFIQKSNREVDDKIYFPDEDFDSKFAVKGRSRVLEKLSSSCGRPFYHSSALSINHTAGLGEFPWMAILAYDLGGVTISNCAGTLISSRHILTAASCVYQNNVGPWNLGELLQVILGDLDTGKDRDCMKISFGERCGDSPVKVGVESIVIHPGFRGSVGVYDLAILTLEKDVEFSDFITPICIPENGFGLDIQQNILTANWQQKQNKKDYILKKFEVQTNGSSIIPLEASGFCTGFPGNPVMVQKNYELGSPFYLIRIDVGGLKSKNCGSVPSPSIFIPGFREWIDENID